MLFKLTATILQYAELTTIQFASVAPTIRLVEQQHIVPVLGSVLYKSLNDAYTAAADETTLTDEQKNLLEKCRCVIGPLLCYYYAPKAEVKLGSAGAQRMESDTNKTAYQNQVANFREQMLREGEQATEILLQFLDENKSDYTDWADSPGYAKYKLLFIKSGSEFDDLFASHSPYRNYLSMRSKMFDVEQNIIQPLLGETLFNHLKEIDQDDDENFSTNEKTLLLAIKKVTAYLTVKTAIPFLNVRMDANGITVMNMNTAQNDQLAKRASADKIVLNSILEACDEAAKAWIETIKTFLTNHPDDFVAYLPETTVTEDQTRNEIGDYHPDCLSGSFGLI